MRRARVLASIAAAVACAGACNAINGVGDLEEVQCTDGCEDAAPDVASPLDSTSGEDSAAGADAAADQSASDVAKDVPQLDGPVMPTFCTGITFYLPFDTSLSTKAGQAPTGGTSAPLAPGKFGMAADLTGLGGAGANVLDYAVASSGSSAPYAVAQGSVAGWIKPIWTPPCTVDHIFFKPGATLNATATSAGPEIACRVSPPAYGIMVEEADGGRPGASFPSGTLTKWVPNDWNHLVGVWQQSPAQMSIALNGGGLNASASSGVSWTPGEAPPAYVRLGSTGGRPQALFDEVVVWNRQLGAQEIAALYASPVPVGEACKL